MASRALVWPPRSIPPAALSPGAPIFRSGASCFTAPCDRGTTGGGEPLRSPRRASLDVPLRARKPPRKGVVSRSRLTERALVADDPFARKATSFVFVVQTPTSRGDPRGDPRRGSSEHRRSGGLVRARRRGLLEGASDRVEEHEPFRKHCDPRRRTLRRLRACDPDPVSGSAALFPGDLPELMERPLQILGYLRFIDDALVGGRVLEDQLLRVERDALDERRRMAIAAVPQHGMADLCEVDPDLVLPPRFEPDTHERGVVEPLPHLEVRDSPFPRPTERGRPDREGSRVLREMGDDCPAILPETPLDDGAVEAPRLARFKLRGERFQGALALGENEEP